MQFLNLKRILIYLVLFDFLLLFIYLYIFIYFNLTEKRLNKNTNRINVSIQRKKSKQKGKNLYLYYKNGERVNYGIRVLSKIDEGEKEDRFEIAGIVEDVKVENNNVFLGITIPGLNKSKKLIFNLGEFENNIGVNKAEDGEIGEYTVDKVGNVYKNIVSNTPILLYVVTRIDTDNFKNKNFCNKDCLRKINIINSNFSKFSTLLSKLSNKEKVVIPSEPIGYVSQIVYFYKKK